MRITAFRAWVSQTMNQGVGAARRAGVAISRRIRAATGKIDAGVGVGDDESSFGGGRGSRAWIELVEEAVKRFIRLFDRSVFERRYVRVEAFLRRLLGLPPKARPPVLPPPKPAARPSAPAPISAEQAARFREQVRLGMVQANTARDAGLRAKVKHGSDGETDPEDGQS